MRSSLLIDLAQGKRIEVEALQGSVVRRAARRRRAGADHVDAVCAAEAVCRRGTPTRLSTASKRGCPCSGASAGIDAEKHAPADVVVDHAFDVIERVVEPGPDGCEARSRRRNGSSAPAQRGADSISSRRLRQYACAPPLPERLGQRPAVERHAPAALLRDERRGLFILARAPRTTRSARCRLLRSPGRSRAP